MTLLQFCNHLRFHNIDEVLLLLETFVGHLDVLVEEAEELLVGLVFLVEVRRRHSNDLTAGPARSTQRTATRSLPPPSGPGTKDDDGRRHLQKPLANVWAVARKSRRHYVAGAERSGWARWGNDFGAPACAVSVPQAPSRRIWRGAA